MARPRRVGELAAGDVRTAADGGPAGVLGRNHAARHGAVAANRAQKLGPVPPTDPNQLRQPDRLFTSIDQRVWAAVEHGVRERLYFPRVPIARLDDDAPGLVKGHRQRYTPITSPAQTDLIAMVRNELRPAPMRLTPAGRRTAPKQPRRLRGRNQSPARRPRTVACAVIKR